LSNLAFYATIWKMCAAFAFHTGSIEHRIQPEGGRELDIYEQRLLFNRDELIGKTVLDLGAGPEAKLAAGLEEKGAYVVSLSPDFMFRQHSHRVQDSFPEGRFAAGLAQALPFRTGTFDAVLALNVEEHLGEQAFTDAVTEMGRVLAPGGMARMGPIVDIPSEPRMAQTIRQQQKPHSVLATMRVAIDADIIPGRTMPKIKDGYGNAYYDLLQHVLVLRKAEN
jgi:SAM-dependent methyltransferase